MSSNFMNNSSYRAGGRRRRSRADWAGVGPGDAFKHNLSYFARRPAQRMFYSRCRSIQESAARLAGSRVGEDFEPEVKPQLAPCYTAYPPKIAAYAAIGLTGFLEFQKRSSGRILTAHVREYVINLSSKERPNIDEKLYRRLGAEATRAVQSRLLLEDLSRLPGMSAVEVYRLFAASQQTLRYETVREVIQSVVLYGDVLPDLSEQRLHPVTRALIWDLEEACRPYFECLPDFGSDELVELGVEWVRVLCTRLEKYVPDKNAAEPAGGKGLRGPGGSRRAGERDSENTASEENPSGGQDDPDAIPPLDEPSPPAATSPPNAAQKIARALSDPQPDADTAAAGGVGQLDEDQHKALGEFAEAVDKASGQAGEHEDLRSDILEDQLGRDTFESGPIEGSPTDGHEVELDIGDEHHAGQLFDRPLEPGHDDAALRKLLNESKPIHEALRTVLYPNIERKPERQRYRTSGALDPARLAMVYHSNAVFRRLRTRMKADRRGSPLLVIACDGSASLEPPQVHMLKLLTAGWLTSTARTRIELLAAVYHSGRVRGGLDGPLVQWLYHPRKSRATSHMDAARALVSLPNNGQGAQSDALSLRFLMEEAKKLARGSTIYLVVISDCEWNRSFDTEKSGAQEVHAVVETSYEDLGHRLHTTLVALGQNSETGFEDQLDRVIRVTDAELDDPAAVAEKIGLQVAADLKTRRSLNAT